MFLQVASLAAAAGTWHCCPPPPRQLCHSPSKKPCVSEISPCGCETPTGVLAAEGTSARPSADNLSELPLAPAWLWNQPKQSRARRMHLPEPRGRLKTRCPLGRRGDTGWAQPGSLGEAGAAISCAVLRQSRLSHRKNGAHLGTRVPLIRGRKTSGVRRCRCCCLPSGLLLRMSAGWTEAPAVVGMCAGLASSRLPWREGRGSPEIWAQSHGPSVASRNSVTCALTCCSRSGRGCGRGASITSRVASRCPPSPHLVKDQLDCV